MWLPKGLLLNNTRFLFNKQFYLKSLFWIYLPVQQITRVWLLQIVVSHSFLLKIKFVLFSCVKSSSFDIIVDRQLDAINLVEEDVNYIVSCLSLNKGLKTHCKRNCVTLPAIRNTLGHIKGEEICRPLLQIALYKYYYFILFMLITNFMCKRKFSFQIQFRITRVT